MGKYEAVMRDMKTSLEQVRRATPIIQEIMGGGEIKAVEGSDNEILIMLDQSCGTDYFYKFDKTNSKYKYAVVWGIGSRFQPVKRSWDTFTIRRTREDTGADTEYAKRKWAIEHNGVYPYLTLHGYFDSDTGEIISFAIARTVDIWEFIAKGLAYIRETHTRTEGHSTFFVIDWAKMLEQGYNIKIYKRSQYERYED